VRHGFPRSRSVRWHLALSEALGLGGGKPANPADDLDQIQLPPMTALGPIERGGQIVQDGGSGPALHLDAHGDVRAQEVDRIDIEHGHHRAMRRAVGPARRTTTQQRQREESSLPAPP